MPTGPLYAGNRHAVKGEWPQAQEEWKKALAKDPANHTALHNMGVAAEAQGRYAEARQYDRQARDATPERMYDEALARVEKAIKDSHVAEIQWPPPEAPVFPASFSAR